MVLPLPNVNADEHVRAVVVLNHDVLPSLNRYVGQRRGIESHIHVTNGLDNSPAPISDYLIPIRPGDNTPRIINDWGQ